MIVILSHWMTRTARPVVPSPLLLMLPQTQHSPQPRTRMSTGLGHRTLLTLATLCLECRVSTLDSTRTCLTISTQLRPMTSTQHHLTISMLHLPTTSTPAISKMATTMKMTTSLLPPTPKLSPTTTLASTAKNSDSTPALAPTRPAQQTDKLWKLSTAVSSAKTATIPSADRISPANPI